MSTGLFLWVYSTSNIALQTVDKISVLNTLISDQLDIYNYVMMMANYGEDSSIYNNATTLKDQYQ